MTGSMGVLKFIRAEIGAGRGFPAHAAIRKRMGWKQTNSVRDCLSRLCVNGHLRRVKKKNNRVEWHLA